MLIVRWCQNYFTQYDCFCRNKITCFFLFKNIQVSHILLCSWFWSTLLWFFFLHCLAPVYFHFLFVIIYSNLFLLTVFNDVAAWLSECGCSCECVCVLCFKKCIQCLRFKNITAIPVIHLCKTCTCVCTKTSKICKIHIPLTSGR